MKFIKSLILLLIFPYLSFSQTLDDYIKIAVENNPELNSYKIQMEAISKRIRQAKTPADPMLMVGITNLPVNFSFTSDMMTMKEIGISQMLMYPEKYSLMGKMAEKDYEIAKEIYESKRLELIANVKMLYFEIYYMTRAVEITKKSIDLLKDFIKITSTRFATGQGIQQDVLKAQVELSKMTDELIRMETERKNIIVRFNSLLYRKASDSVYIPDEISFVEFKKSYDEIEKLAFENNPMIIAMKKMVEKDSIMTQLAKKEIIPDFEIKFSYGQRSAVDPLGMKALDVLSFSIGFNLPIFFRSKQNLRIQETMLNVSQSEAKLLAIKNEISKMIYEKLNEIDGDLKLIDLYKNGLIPQATQNLNVGLVGYQVGKIDFMTLVDNFMTLYNYQIQYEKIFASYNSKIAELEMLAGTNLR
ncbi:TolC family protein [Candidatus Chrysopegis kryptomonas]|uniref:Outer membrane protein TolC n=1 Tax=Candidatus Chryseopegocella kryptomonas TaxID=1633643 RepID=A0A0P1P111_9BACT|nr:TolC family protein [Candidatus Chrysopegis kryptomonas]CUT04279.1 Outer membrane protein TolC [Candidatus Chrysopegis kryptomonas]